MEFASVDALSDYQEYSIQNQWPHVGIQMLAMSKYRILYHLAQALDTNTA